jgi:hypothetical protein
MNAISVKILNMVNNPQVTKAQSMQVGTSETIRSLSDIDDKWLDWLAGLIDGAGCFLLSKKGYASLEITMDIRDCKCLYNIKHYFGGSIKYRSGVKAMRYRLHHFSGIKFILNKLNGRIRNPIRQLQFSKLCEKYNIVFNFPEVLKYNNGWLSGFFDAEGTININKSNLQLSISILKKTPELLYPLVFLYGGNVSIDKSLNGRFKWYITKRTDVEILINNYFKNYPSRAVYKNSRLHLISQFYFIKSLDLDQNIQNNIWSDFFNKWFKNYDQDNYNSDKDIVH